MKPAIQQEHGPALTDRLAQVAAVLLAEPPPPAEEDPWVTGGRLLDLLVRDISSTLAPDRMWLLWAAVATVLPTPEEVRGALRAFELNDPDAAAVWLLDECMAACAARGWPDADFEIVSDAVIAEVDFSARHDLHTGIQRVVRSTLPHWLRDHDLQIVAWTPTHGALRTLTPVETARVVDWANWRAGAGVSGPAVQDVPEWKLVLPWHCVLILPEVPAQDTCDRLAAVAQFSGNSVVAVGYDCIPVVSADLVPPAEPNRFVKYLAAVKYMRRVAGISESATVEFQGFAQMLETQGLSGPEVVECALPSETVDARGGPTADEQPCVVCVGSFEPRKNQRSLIYAAEVLWREGLDFRLQFIGGGGVGNDVSRAVRRLARKGRPISIATAVTDTDLDVAYANARFTVFTSTHEGYGLPVAESLARGTPVITSDYGSTREVGAAGGTVLIDPRDDTALVDAMRELLTDDDRVTKLREEISRRPDRSWADYADDLWTTLVGPERVAAR